MNETRRSGLQKSHRWETQSKNAGKKTCLCQFKACLSGSSLPYSLYNGHLRRKIICNRDYLLCKTNPSSDNCRAKSKAFWENVDEQFAETETVYQTNRDLL